MPLFDFDSVDFFFSVALFFQRVWNLCKNMTEKKWPLPASTLAAEWFKGVYKADMTASYI